LTVKFNVLKVRSAKATRNRVKSPRTQIMVRQIQTLTSSEVIDWQNLSISLLFSPHVKPLTVSYRILSNGRQVPIP
jgi:hypothetical protein